MNSRVKWPVLILLVTVSAHLLGCASRQAAGSARSSEGIRGEITEPTDMGQDHEGTSPEKEFPATGVYDIEEEMPEQRDLDEEEKIEEKLTYSRPDSFHVEDITDSVTEGESYSVGYRIQIFASKDLEKAKEVKREMTDQTSMSVYIEFEDGMYKVRVGNFGSRDEAAEARKKLMQLYPDCWIAETTVKTQPR